MLRCGIGYTPVSLTRWQRSKETVVGEPCFSLGSEQMLQLTDIIDVKEIGSHEFLHHLIPPHGTLRLLTMQVP